VTYVNDFENQIVTSYVNNGRVFILKWYSKGLAECKKIGQFSLPFGSEHEARLVEGRCLPQAAQSFLAILDHAQTSSSSRTGGRSPAWK